MNNRKVEEDIVIIDLCDDFFLGAARPVSDSPACVSADDISIQQVDEVSTLAVGTEAIKELNDPPFTPIPPDTPEIDERDASRSYHDVACIIVDRP